MSTKSILPNGVTPEMIDDWKKQYGGCRLIIITDKENPNTTYRFVCRDPLAYKFIDKDLFKFSETLVKNAWLGGDEIIKERPEYIMSAGAKVAELLDKSEAEMINL
jgi:hypothetical protein